MTHGKSKWMTATASNSLQQQTIYWKSKWLMAKESHSLQQETIHWKSKWLTAKANDSRQKKVRQGNSKRFIERRNYSRQNKVTHFGPLIKYLILSLLLLTLFASLALIQMGLIFSIVPSLWSESTWPSSSKRQSCQFELPLGAVSFVITAVSFFCQKRFKWIFILIKGTLRSPDFSAEGRGSKDET